MNGLVTFVGGRLDGKQSLMPETPLRYYAPEMRRRPISFELRDFDPSMTPSIEYTTYELVERGPMCYYVEEDLLDMAYCACIDPIPIPSPEPSDAR